MLLVDSSEFLHAADPELGCEFNPCSGPFMRFSGCLFGEPSTHHGHRHGGVLPDGNLPCRCLCRGRQQVEFGSCICSELLVSTAKYNGVLIPILTLPYLVCRHRKSLILVASIADSLLAPLGTFNWLTYGKAHFLTSLLIKGVLLVPSISFWYWVCCQP
jgi:hypothetical protein